MKKLKPPKEFFDEVAPEIRKKNPNYTDEQVDAIVADIWYNKAKPETKARFNKQRKERTMEKSAAIDDRPRTPKGFNQKEFEMGMEDEREHSSDKRLLEKIVTDHLKELPDYYTRLRRMMTEGKAALKKSMADDPMLFVELNADSIKSLNDNTEVMEIHDDND